MFDDYYGGYNYYGQTPHTYQYAFSGFFGGVAAFLITLFLLYAFIAYIFQSIGLYHLAKDRGIAHAWFAWVPILNGYIIGRLINNKVVLGDSIVLGHAEFFLPLVGLISAVSTTSAISFWPALIAALCFVYEVSGLFRLFKIYRPKSRVSFTIWSCILGPGFFIYAIRNDRPYDPLEPDKIYQNFYAGKNRIDESFDHREEEIRAKELERKNALFDEYEKELHQEGLTYSQKDQITKQYHENRDSLEETYEDFLAEERKERRDEITALDDEVKEAASEDYETVEDREPQSETEINAFEIFETSPLDEEVSNVDVDDDSSDLDLWNLEINKHFNENNDDNT